MEKISIGYSPCPNDTFAFHALSHQLAESGGLEFSEPRLEDVETLNRLALDGVLDVSKVSYGALPFILDRYVLLKTGGAMGRGCGPLIVARDPRAAADLKNCRVAIPGRMTTANLLFRLFGPEARTGIELPYDQIMPAVVSGEVDAGLIIHESRFTFHEHGLVRILDLGDWWERATGSPIPLGAVVAKRELGRTIPAIEDAIRSSVRFAMDHPAASADHVREHAREMSGDVTRQHIELYVNRYTVDLGTDGQTAIRDLMERARSAGLLPLTALDPFSGDARL